VLPAQLHLQEDENDQDLLLDSSVPPVAQRQGSLIELPLSYNLTGHTGSFMYMAPEVFKVRFRVRVQSKNPKVH
jgi:hypothetical protein